MPDNWNKLADLLGTPSIDPIGRKPATQKQIPKATVAEQDVAPRETATDSGGDAANPTMPAAEVAKSSPPETKSRLKNTWDAVAEFFGVAAPEPTVEEPVVESAVPAPIESHAASKSFWQVEDDDHDRTQRAAQRVSDELLGKRDKPAEPEDDLDKLLAGFRQRPEQPASSEEPTNATVETSFDEPVSRPNSRDRRERNEGSDRGDRNERRPQRGGRSERGRDANARGGRGDSDAADRNIRTESRGRRGEPRRTPDEVEEVVAEPTRGRRRSSQTTEVQRDSVQRDSVQRDSVQRDSVQRDSFGAEMSGESGTPERRGRRRPSRRAIAEGVVEKVPEDDLNVEFVELDDSTEDSTIDPSRRRQQRWSKDRAARAPRRDSEVAGERRPSRGDRDELPTRQRKTSAWEDPELTPLSDEDAELDIVDSSEGDASGDGQGRRRRRRRRRPSSPVDNEGTDEVASTGRQIYGRHADESEDGDDEVDKLRTAVIVPWVDAISVIVDKNMKNHRHAPPNTRGGRGGSPRGGGNRRPTQ